jgi:hypothetical protein
VTTNLVECLKCNHPTSPSAEKCPKCDFVNARCQICNDRVEPRSLLSGNEIATSVLHYHRDCIEKLFSYPEGLACDVCNMPLRHEWLDSFFPYKKAVDTILPHERYSQAVCPSCGDQRPFGSGHIACKHCRLGIAGFQEVCRKADDVYHAYCRPDVSNQNKKSRADAQRRKADREEELQKRIRRAEYLGYVYVLLPILILVLLLWRFS